MEGQQSAVVNCMLHRYIASYVLGFSATVVKLKVQRRLLTSRAEVYKCLQFFILSCFKFLLLNLILSTNSQSS